MSTAQSKANPAHHPPHPAGEPAAALRVVSVSRHYQSAGSGSVAALRDVSFELATGAFLAITGPSGCGKSTLLNLIAALDTPDSGSLFVGGTDLAKTDEATRTLHRRTGVGIVFQFFNLLPGLSVEENAALPLRLQGVNRQERLDRARELLDFVGLGHRRQHQSHQLSGGEMQRCAIARALIHSPPLILADEPTGNLDTAAATAVLDVFERIRGEGRATLVLVTHSEETAALAGERIRMQDGTILSHTRRSPSGSEAPAPPKIDG